MKFEVIVVPDYEEFSPENDQHIATFENVDEEFMDEIVDFISTIRDVKCRYEEQKLAPSEGGEYK